MQSINPATGKIIKEYKELTPPQVEKQITKTDQAFSNWQSSTLDSRSKLMNQAAHVLRSRKDQLALLITEEMGKPIHQSQAEVQKCAWVCEYYATCAAEFLAEEQIETEAKKSFVSFQPLGVILAVMPWNFPLWQVFRFAAPALMAGNASLLKHASNVCGSALAIEQIFLEAGFSENLFKTLLVRSTQVDEIIAHPKVAAVTLTGSSEAGKSVASSAGRNLKKCVLELGGSDPYVILKDAHLESAADQCVESRLNNAGQSCIAAKRFIVCDEVHDDFVRKVVKKMKARRIGDPGSPQTQIGPLARKDLRDELHQQVQQSRAAGANILLGGQIPNGPGFFYPPTVLSDVSKDSPAYDQELFGPVAAIIRAQDSQHAIQIANDTNFGLGAAIFTQNVQQGERLAEKHLHAGACFVNTFVRSDPRLPFGGIKESGYGRELSSFGIREFVNIKTVYIA
jgi:succinate-semialdehyde dehydrogenase/glutarate-semialdehyde dehydrogenase